MARTRGCARARWAQGQADLLPEGVSSLPPTAGRSGSALGSVGPFLKGGLTAAAEEDEAASEAVAAVWVAAGF